jgi:hypothetical protein
VAVTVQVRVHDGTNWNTLPESQISDLRVIRRVGAGGASFQVNDATIAQRDLLRTGRECEIQITVDGVTKFFGGFIDRPRIQVQAPGHFNIRPRVVDLTHGATWRIVGFLIGTLGTKYTQLITDFWSTTWPIDLTGVQDDPKTHPEDYRTGFDTLANFTSEIVRQFLPDWVWWVGHNGSNASGILKKLYVQPRGFNDLTGTVTLTESDIGVPFDIEATVDPRNTIWVIGDDDPDTDFNDPLMTSVSDTNSQTAYGTRDLIVKESERGDVGALANIGAGVLERRKFDLWQGRFRINRWDLEPGDKVLMHLPTIGVENAGVGVPWVLEQVEERVNRGVARRFGTFVEHVDAAFFRVT